MTTQKKEVATGTVLTILKNEEDGEIKKDKILEKYLHHSEEKCFEEYKNLIAYVNKKKCCIKRYLQKIKLFADEDIVKMTF